MKKITPVLMATLCLGGGPAASEMDSLVERHGSARGGARAIEAVRAVGFELEIIEPEFQLDGRYFATRSGCMRIDAFMNGRHAISEGISSEGGWALDGGAEATRPQPDGGTEILLHGIENPTRLIGLHELRSRGHSLSYDGRVELDQQPFEKLTVVYADGYSAEIYLDPETFLIARMRERKPMHYEVDPTKLHIETRFSDYRAVEGVMFPFLSEEVDWETGAQLGRTIVKSISVNSPAALRICEPPLSPVTAGDR